ncbi:MAG: FAD-dependent oxidoreductase [Archangium sp.]
MKVAIIGAGLGGLALANALRDAKMDVGVFEATRSSEGRRRASRIALDETGVQALRGCVSEHLFAALEKTSGQTMKALSVRDDQMRLLSRTEIPKDIVPHVLIADRTVMRDLLIASLGPQYFEGERFVGYLKRDDGRYDLHFADGKRVIADVVVGADGVQSTVRKLRFPDWRHEQVSTFTFTGRMPLSAYTLLPREVLEDDTAIVGSETTTMLLAPYRVRDGGTVAFSKLVTGRTPPQDSLSWHFTTPRSLFEHEAALPAARPRDLHLLMRAQVAKFAPELKAIVEQTDPESVTLCATEFVPSLPEWKSEPVTLLGDAIHALPPTAPIGVNAVLHDARTLARELIAVRDGKPLHDAIAAYETSLRETAAAAVEEAKKVHRMASSGGDWLRRLRARFLPSMVKFELWKRRRSNVTSSS